MKTVLIVEDDVDLRQMFSTALGIDGYRVLQVSPAPLHRAQRIREG